jgi:hypothetical protein
METNNNGENTMENETMTVEKMSKDEKLAMMARLQDGLIQDEADEQMSGMRAELVEKLKRRYKLGTVSGVVRVPSQYTVNEDTARVVEYVRESANPVSKSAICQALGIGDSRWNSVAPELNKAGLICQGKGRHCVWTVVSGNGGGV